MDQRANKIAALANIAVYDAKRAKNYVDGAPHVKHASLRLFCSALMVQVFEFAHQVNKHPRVLDLGAGEGSMTLPFLELGANVVAVDISMEQLKCLGAKSSKFNGFLNIRCEDIDDTLRVTGEMYDIVVVNSFLHHIPDYMDMIRRAIRVINKPGQFLSIQDPLRYDTVGKFDLIFSKLAYFSWRIFKGDVVGGIKRRIRRSHGLFLEDSPHDNAEYHVTRNGVDQDAIAELFISEGFECRIIKYYSTQNAFFQKLGNLLNIENTFAIVAIKK